MSTKIYNAYTYVGKGGLPRLITYLKKVRKLFWYKTLSHLKNEHLKTGKEFDFYEFKEAIQKEILGGCYTPLNVEASIVIYPLKDRILVQFFGMGDAFVNRRLFKDYHYQNSTDKPEKLTNKEWREREKTWDKIFNDSPTPSTAGLIFRVIDFSDAYLLAYDIAAELRKEKEVNEANNTVSKNR